MPIRLFFTFSGGVCDATCKVHVIYEIRGCVDVYVVHM